MSWVGGDLGRTGTAFGIAARSAALPVVVGARWLRLRRRHEDVPHFPVTLRVAAKVFADELFLAAEVLSGAFVKPGDRQRLKRELESAFRFFQERGFLSEPSRYHVEPPPLVDTAVCYDRAWGLDYQQLSFESGWSPHPGEPGAERYAGYKPNETAHVRILSHPGAARPWVVCTPGFRMGQARVDFAGFKVRWLHRDLGLNVAIPVLPFHGPRQVGRRGGDGFLTGDVLDTIHAQSQAVWDVRRLIGWLRGSGAQQIGLYGVSLGAYTSGLVASLEDDLDCVIAGVPASDWVTLVTGHAPKTLLRASERLGFPWIELRQILRVVSPLALRSRVPRDRSFVFAGTSDRLAPPEQAVELWKHWGRPRIAWYAGGHVSYLVEPAVTRLVREALQTSGLVAPTRVRSRSPRAVAI